MDTVLPQKGTEEQSLGRAEWAWGLKPSVHRQA